MFAMRYLNSTALGNADGPHKLQYAQKSSPYQPNEDGTAYAPTGNYVTDYAHMWPAEDWIDVPGGVFKKWELIEEP
jgi:hypothetical protein